ncbi:FecR domain-containing protein [Sphingomonas sp. NFR15]|uniref:FecR family protein n=1 Tax=Sphingomonas sp. NFR15 TaxID=1566282 RepID=UPI0008924F3E|nr:FecR domain-containing protein [Sphingomonas sp. NFR15]SDA36867.1 FecR family protein [Sphingomonas sp. NFR15]
MNDNDASGGDALTQAAHWYARLQTLPVSARTLDQFFAWRRGEGHREAFDAVDRLYRETGKLAERPAIVAATEQAITRFAAPPRRRYPWPGAIAAAIVGVVAVGFTTVAVWPSGGEHYATRIGEQRTIRLADGSKLMLDTDTALIVSFTKDARRISLARGQAYFTVAHDAVRPFTVDAGGASVLAMGTQFDVQRSGDRIDVTLIEGRVRVSSARRPVTQLQPGQRLVLVSSRISPVQAIDTTPITAWTRGRIVLDGMTLEHAIAEVNRYVNTPVRLGARRFANARISGSVETGDIGSFTTAVTAVLPLKAQANSDGSVTLRS